MLVIYRDDGFWTLLWLRCWFILAGGRLNRLPGYGFVGQESSSFRAPGPQRVKLRLTRMRRLHSTPGARLWRLTCVWDRSPELAPRQYGTGSVPAGSLLAAAGEGISRPETRTISTSASE